MGKVLRKAFRILGLDERKGVGNGTRLSWKLSGQCYMVFYLFLWCFCLNCANSGIALFEDLFTLHKLAGKVILTIKTDDVTSSRKNMDPHGRLRAAQGRMS